MACSCVLRSWRSRTTVQSILAKQRMNSYATLVKDCQMKPKQEGFNNIYNHHSLFRSGAPTLQSYAKLLQNIRSFYTSRQQVILKNRGNTIFYRMKSTRDSSKTNAERHRSIAMYALSVAILVGGLSYAAVPLYRLYCQASGYGGTVRVASDIGEKIENMEKQKHRVLKVKFNADKGATMQWNFRPQQTEIKIVPGETALAFYTAKNPTDVAITGVSTYNVIPFEAGQYFNKIQCFCFEEQRLNPGEEVDMPVFFYIDPEFVLDPYLAKVTEITLSYTFFEAKEMSWADLQQLKK